MVYSMTEFGGTAQATIFHALKGVFRENAHAPMKASKFFGISIVHLSKFKSQTNWAVICTRKFPQRLHYVEGSETDVRYQKLVDLKNRGGLWKVNLSTEAIFQSLNAILKVILKTLLQKLMFLKLYLHL